MLRVLLKGVNDVFCIWRVLVIKTEVWLKSWLWRVVNGLTQDDPASPRISSGPAGCMNKTWLGSGSESEILSICDDQLASKKQDVPSEY